MTLDFDSYWSSLFGSKTPADVVEASPELVGMRRPYAVLWLKSREDAVRGDAGSPERAMVHSLRDRAASALCLAAEQSGEGHEKRARAAYASGTADHKKKETP